MRALNSRKLHTQVIFFGCALAFFLALNAFRFVLSRGAGDITLLQADYALPPAALWLARRLHLGRRTMIAILLVTTGLVLTIDAVFVAGRQFHWGPEAIPQYVSAYSDLPWRIIAPVGGSILLVTVVGAFTLVRVGRSRFAIWPLLLFLLACAAIDARIGTSRFRDARGSVNIVATAIADLGPLYFGSLIRGGSLQRITTDTMAAAILAGPDTPQQILSVGLESFGWAHDPAIRAALVAPLLKQVQADYDVEQSAHPFFGSTLQGEIRELCGARLVGSATAPRVARKLKMCLPSILARRGYETGAFHGNGGRIYARKSVYPAIGFRRSWFYNDLHTLSPKVKPCPGVLFNGACDLDVYEHAVALFDGRKRFVHVMSLDSHLPVPDSTSNACTERVAEDSSLCSYSIIIRRSLGELGMVLRQARHKPDVIFLYGDHAPPFSSLKLREQFSRTDVPFIVLKRKQPSGAGVVKPRNFPEH